MVGLLDIAPAGETVDIGGAKVSVPGISAKGIVLLASRFPELRALFAGSDAIGTEQLLSTGVEAVAALIASGCGLPGNEEAEQKAASFPLGIQADLLDAILRATLPKGVGPFVERLAALKGVLVRETANLSQASSPQPSVN